MTIEDNKKYKLTGEQIKDLASRISILGAEADGKAEKALSGNDAPTTSTPGQIGQLYVQSDGTVYILKDIIEESGDESGALAQFVWEEFGAGTEYTAGDGINISAQDVISATNTGRMITLTSADYNYPADNPSSVALWLLDPGLYTWAQGFGANVRATRTHLLDNRSMALVKLDGYTSGLYDITVFGSSNSSGSGGNQAIWSYRVSTSDGWANGTPHSLSYDINNTLTSTRDYESLSAAQGKVLNDKIGDLATLTTTAKTSAVAAINELADTVDDIEPQSGSGAPTSSTEGTIGQTYVDTTTGDIYYLSEIVEESGEPDTYVWKSFVSGNTIVPLTSADYNWNNTAGNATTTPFDSIALWRLDPGVYTIAEANIYVKGEISHRSSMRVGNTILVTPLAYAGPYDIKGIFFTNGETITHYTPNVNNGNNVSHKGAILYEDQIGRSRQITSDMYDAASQSGGSNDYCRIWMLPAGTYYGTQSTVQIQEYSNGPIIGAADKIYIIGEQAGGIGSRCILKITTEGAYKLNFVGGSYTSTEKLLTENDFNMTMTGVDPGQGTPTTAGTYTAVYGGDPIILDYSLSEINTGMKWIDGSTIYKKTVSLGTLPSGSKNVAHGISNLAYVIKTEGYATNSTTLLPLPYVATVASSQIGFNIYNGNIVVQTGSDRTDYSGYLTLYYTKSS